MKLLFGKKDYICPYCQEHYTFTRLQAHRLKDKTGHIRCYYCRRHLQLLQYV